MRKRVGCFVLCLMLAGCGSGHFNVAEENWEYTNLGIICSKDQKEVLLDTEESEFLMQQLENCTFSKKGNRSSSKGDYQINVLKGMHPIDQFQIIDEHSIVYSNNIYTSDESINLELVKKLVENDKVTSNEAIEEKVFKVANSDILVKVYVSKASPEEGAFVDKEKVHQIIVEANGISKQYDEPGFYFDGLQWIDNQKKAVLAYESSDMGKNFMIMDLETCELIYDKTIDHNVLDRAFEKAGEDLTSEMDEEGRLDLSYRDISNEGNKIMIHYDMNGAEGKEQSGSFWYDLKTKEISAILKD